LVSQTSTTFLCSYVLVFSCLELKNLRTFERLFVYDKTLFYPISCHQTVLLFKKIFSKNLFYICYL